MPPLPDRLALLGRLQEVVGLLLATFTTRNVSTDMSFYKNINDHVSQAKQSFYAPSESDLDGILDHVAKVHRHWIKHTSNGNATDPITASNLTLATVLLELAVEATDATTTDAPQQVTIHYKGKE